MTDGAAGRRALVAAGGLLLSLAAGCADNSPEGGSPTAGPAVFPLTVGGRPLLVEVAATDITRARGFMFRRSLEPGRGMLFVFREAEVRSFWMKNTYVPLDLAYADDEGRIFQIERMEPLSLAPRVSTAPARYALEVPAGWFAANGLASDVQMQLSDEVRRLPVE